MLIILFAITLLVVRGIQVYMFIQHISKKCDIYDWRYVDEHPMSLLEIIEDDYYVVSEWSAYNFLFLKGPSPLSMFFSFKRLTLENIYSEENVDKLKKYEIN
jgi:hypothetical protein